MELRKVIGQSFLPKAKLAKASKESQPEASALPADSYAPAKGVGWARTVGKAKRWVAQGGLMGLAGLGVMTAVGAPGVVAALALAFSGGAAYTAHLLTQGNVEQSQGEAFSQQFHDTLKTTTALASRKQNFANLEAALQTVDTSKSLGTKMKGTRKAEIRTDEKSGLRYLFKSQESGSKLRRNVPPHSENKREVAAYLVDKHLGHYARVPPSVMTGNDEMATFIVDKAKARDDSNLWLSGNKNHDGYRRLAIFDNIIGNLDRHPGNFLATAEGKIVPIDHGLAFPTKNSKQDSSINYMFDKKVELTQGETMMLSGFLANKEAISKELSEYLEPEAIAAMMERVDAMLKAGSTDDTWRKGSKVKV